MLLITINFPTALLKLKLKLSFKMNKIAVIGGGAWGCALASAILKKGYYPFILTSSTKRAEHINIEF